MSDEKSQPAFDEWAKVDLFGHQTIVGRVTEASLAGGAFLRVDVPAFNGRPAFTRFFGPSAIYSISPISEELARQFMGDHRNEPVNRFDLPQLADKVQPFATGGEDDEDETHDERDDYD